MAFIWIKFSIEKLSGVSLLLAKHYFHVKHEKNE